MARFGDTRKTSRAKDSPDAQGKWLNQPLRETLGACLAESAGPGPSRETLARALDLARPIANGTTGWYNKLSDLVRGRHLSPELRDALITYGGWTPNQQARLGRADIRFQLRRRERRSALPEETFEPVSLTVITAGNIDYTISFPNYISAIRAQGETHVETFSGEPEKCVTTFEDFEIAAAELSENYGMPFEVGPGGSGVNVAITMRRLDEPHEVAVVTVSGGASRLASVNHAASGTSAQPTLAQSLEAEGVDTLLVARSPNQAGCTASVVMPHGADVRRVMLTWPGANVEFADRFGDSAWDVVDRLRASQVVHLTSLFDESSPSLVADIVEYAKSVNEELRVTFDPGDLWCRRATGVDAASVRRILALADVLFVNERELDSLVDRYVASDHGVTPGLSGPAAERPGRDDLGHVDSTLLREEQKATLVRDVLMSESSASGRTVVVVKHRGAASVYAPEINFSEEIPPLSSKDIVDDTGAGDAFAAGFLHSWIRDADLASATLLGLHTARVKLVHLGLAPAEALADLGSGSSDG